ncbi:TIGR03086 family metal-binding protein [Streptomyces yaanensis]|uniref:TIGR03086 family metal-binding protein n=1 Tax=Streptomyces yaanensis TaxID=1142239 RepID=A0ABV7SFZ9_9ACTN|nr:TIGR03086 family metal-binding protein [Streptomyces sp. CGMCC 4.7035]WNB97932.1 TIGR03086 family metal-binding protein [Streptomyces sp. CGMCC 4.7035]
MDIDPRPVYARAAEQVAALIKTVGPEQLAGPTPCTDFDVRTLLSHLVGGTRRIAVVGAGGDGLAVRPFVDGVADDGWSAAYDGARTEVRRAWAEDARLDATVRVPWGETSGRNALSGYVMEAVTHTWDLSEALGRPLELDPELAEFALAVARLVLPAPDRGDDGPFASAVAAPEGADAYGELGAWLGRRGFGA